MNRAQEIAVKLSVEQFPSVEVPLILAIVEAAIAAAPEPPAPGVGIGVAHISDAMPHLVVRTSAGVEVLPVQLVRDVVAGRQPVAVLGEPLVRAMLGDYLKDLGQ